MIRKLHLKESYNSSEEVLDDELQEIAKLLHRYEGKWKSEINGGIFECRLYHRELKDGASLFSLVWDNDSSESDDILYVPSKSKYVFYPYGKDSVTVNSLNALDKAMKKEFDYLRKV
jgi:hypothetical protein